MITVTEYKNQKVGVFGLGKAGEAAVTSLLAGGAEVMAWDDKSSKEEGVYKNFQQWDWENLKALVLSPGVPLTHPKPHAVVVLAHKHHVPVIGEMELLYRTQPDATYIGITGTNGKSTTTTLVGHILKESGITCEVGGNLGTPALALAPLGKGGVYVIEMSSYQLDLVKTTRFNIAVFLNITPDHLDRHGDMEGYVAAKKHIFDRQTKDDLAVIAADDEYSKGIRQQALGSSVIEVSSNYELTNGVYVKDGMLYDTSLKPKAYSLLPITSLTGKHNWQNAAAAYAAVSAVGVLPDKIYSAMKNFAGLRHRLQLVATINGVRFINDSKATNADATGNALAPYNNILWIAGGKAKAGGIEPLEPYFSHIKHAFLIGEAQEDFAKTLEGKVEYTRCGTLEVAVAKASEMAFNELSLRAESEAIQVLPQDDSGLPRSKAPRNEEIVVLLSPACASFDQFKSFEHRGDVFCELVENLKNKAIEHAS